MSETVVVDTNQDAANAAEGANPIAFNDGDVQGDAQNGDWRQSLPKDHRDAPYVSKYKSQEEFLKGVANMASLVGKKADGVKLPGEDADEAAWDDFYKGIGRPETPNDYGIKLDGKYKEYFQEGDAGEVAEMFHKAGLNSRQAQGVIEQYLAWQGGKIESFQEKIEQEKLAAVNALKSEWKDDYAKNIDIAKRGAEAAGVLDMLEETGLGNHPAVIKLAEFAGRAVKEDHARDGSGFSRSVSLQQAEAELNQIVSDPYFRKDPVKSARANELSEMLTKSKPRSGDNTTSMVITR